jgi:hypothetical protein
MSIPTQNEIAEIIDYLGSTPEIITRCRARLRTEQLTLRPTRDAFSFQEQVWHLRDIEVEGYSIRLKRLLNEVDPVLKDINGLQLAIERDYNNLDYEPGFESFSKARLENAAILRTLNSTDLARKGIYEDGAQISVAALVEMMRSHDAEHRQEINELVETFGRNDPEHPSTE